MKAGFMTTGVTKNARIVLNRAFQNAGPIATVDVRSFRLSPAVSFGRRVHRRFISAVGLVVCSSADGRSSRPHAGGPSQGAWIRLRLRSATS